VDRWLAARAFIAVHAVYGDHAGWHTRSSTAPAGKGYALLEQQLEREGARIAVPIRTRNAGVVGAIGISLAMEKETPSARSPAPCPSCRAEYSLRTLPVVPPAAPKPGRLSTTAGDNAH